MSTLNMKLTRAPTCSHLSIDVAIDGALRRRVVLHTDDFGEAITDEEMEAATRVLLRLYRMGRTVNQTRTALGTGIEVTL